MIKLLVNYTSKELDLVARLMRAEALGEGNLGMLMVGNVIVNRAIASCDTFKNIRTLYDVVCLWLVMLVLIAYLQIV